MTAKTLGKADIAHWFPSHHSASSMLHIILFGLFTECMDWIYCPIFILVTVINTNLIGVVGTRPSSQWTSFSAKWEDVHPCLFLSITHLNINSGPYFSAAFYCSSYHTTLYIIIFILYFTKKVLYSRYCTSIVGDCLLQTKIENLRIYSPMVFNQNPCNSL